MEHTFQMKISEGRRVVLPAEICERLMLEVGDMVVFRLEQDKVALDSLEGRVKHFRARLRQRLPKGASLSKELIAERRAQAKHE